MIKIIFVILIRLNKHLISRFVYQEPGQFLLSGKFKTKK